MYSNKINAVVSTAAIQQEPKSPKLLLLSTEGMKVGHTIYFWAYIWYKIHFTG